MIRCHPHRRWSREDEFTENLRFLAHDAPWYFPDLVAADLVVGKTGYSTVAEAFQGQTAYGYVQRPDFSNQIRSRRPFLTGICFRGKLKSVNLQTGPGWNSSAACRLQRTHYRGPKTAPTRLPITLCANGSRSIHAESCSNRPSVLRAGALIRC